MTASGPEFTRRAFLALAALAPIASAAEQAAVEFESSDARLVEGFRWAKQQALGYVHRGDPVGDWYEAALPGRDAFCMRDVSHQSLGAQILGLQAVTRNMLRKFAVNVAASRQWCSYWEIDKQDRPAPVDYKNDQDFWYNLPANFDILHCCFRQYLWTGDPAYLNDPAFLNFYDRTVRDYVQSWDKDGDGIPESYKEYGHRGIGSYDEDLDFHVLVGADLITAEAAALRDYAAIQELRSQPATAREYRRKAGELIARYNNEWWDSGTKTFHRAMRQDRTFSPNRDGAIPALWFGVTEPGQKTERSLDALKAENIEVRSYFPEVAFRHGRFDWAYDRILELTDPRTKRREYPEVSFAVVGAVAGGMMGIRPDARKLTIETSPGLASRTAWASIRNVPVFHNEISVRHDGRESTTVTNAKGPALVWRPRFSGRPPMPEIELVPGRTRTVRVS